MSTGLMGAKNEREFGRSIGKQLGILQSSLKMSTGVVGAEKVREGR
jgi:hypothetical protein